MSGFGTNSTGDPVSVALSRAEIVAYDSRLSKAGGPAWRMPLEPPTADNPEWPALITALRTLATLTGETRGHLAIALMPSVAETRRVDVPPLTEDELELVLARNAARYFVSAQGAQLVAVSTDARGDRSGAIAASAPAWLVRVISAAARDAGWTLEHIAPAEAAWSAAARAAWGSPASGNAQLLVHQTDHTHALALTDGVLTGVRRFRSAAADAAVFVETVAPSVRLLAAGNGVVRKEWMTALGTRSLTVTLPTNAPAEIVNDGALLAAAAVADVESLVFRTDETRAADRRQRTRMVYAVFAAAAVILAMTAGFRLWDVQRELAAVQAAREALRPELKQTVLGRASVETVSGQLQTLAAAERSSVQWSSVIADLTENLPEDAYLTALRGWSDSVRFEGLATHASAVFPPLSRAESFLAVKAAAAVRLEPQVDGSSLEKFTLVARLRPRVPTATVSADTTQSTRATAKTGA